MIALSLIDEDPSQPRSRLNPGFSAQSIGELAASFGINGPKSPISLRENSNLPGRYIINHGHRRYRAAKVKGLSSIPSFIDNDYNEVDQVIENLQRNELTPREIADWIGRELAKGKKKSEIGKSIGKSASYVSQHAALLDLPSLIAEAFHSGRIKDVTVVNELVIAYKKNAVRVAAWLAEPRQEITRGEVKLLREFLKQKLVDALQFSDDERDDESDPLVPNVPHQASNTELPEKSYLAEKIDKAIVLVEHSGRPARLNLRRRPSAVGMGWLKYEDDGQEFEGQLADVKLIAVIEGGV